MDRNLSDELRVVEEILRDANDRRARNRLARWSEKDWEDNWEEMDESPHYTDYEDTDWEHEDDEEEPETSGVGADGVPAEDQPEGIPREVTEEELFRVRASQKPIDDDNFGPGFIYFDLKMAYINLGRIVIKLSRFNPAVERHFTNLARDNTTWPQHNLQSFEGSSLHRKCDKFLEGGVMMEEAVEAESIYTPQPVTNSAYYDKYTMIANEDINDHYGGCRFLITTKKLLHCDPGHIPVGVVVKGRHIIDQMLLLPCEENGDFTFTPWVESCGTLTKHDLVRANRSWERPRAIDNHVRFGAHLNKKVRTLSPSETECEDSDEDEERSRPRRRIVRRPRLRNANRRSSDSP